LICKFLCVPFLIKAQGNLFRYADSLQGAGHYAVAAVEYERIIFERPGTTEAVLAALSKANCEKMLGRYDQAAAGLDAVNTAAVSDSLRYRVLFEGMVCAYLAHEPASAFSKQEMIAHYFPDSAASRDLLLLKVLCLNELKKWHQADTVYKRYMKLWGGGYVLASDPYLHLPKLKDPEKAERLSAYLPFTGAGLFYAGDVPEGLLNMALQVGFIAFGAYSVLAERYITGVLIGVGGYAAFYHGGVRRARRLAELHNERVSIGFNNLVRAGLMAAGTSAETSSGNSR